MPSSREYVYTTRQRQTTKPMRVTQTDIARIANVSQATVSRVLAGDVRVEDDKRLRVIEAMEQVNYRPDVRAQALRRKRTNLIGIVLKRGSETLKEDPFIASLVSEITSVLSDTPFHLCIDVAKDSREQSRVYDELLRSRRVDGLILVEPEMNDGRLQRLQNDKFPFVVIGNPRTSNFHSVDNDNVLAGRMATLHLIESGFKNIGFLTGPQGVIVVDDRLTGYRMAMAENSLAPRVWHSDFGLEAAACATREILEDPAGIPEALVVLDDYMATGVVRSAYQAGLQVPRDLAMVSFNDTNLAQLVEGGLTSVNMNFDKLVQEAVDKLLALIENKGPETPTRHVVPCELKVRGSSKKFVREGIA